MQLSSTSRYAIRILSYMAKQKDTQHINATVLAEVLSIPYKFLTKIMTELVNAGFLISIRGREGGYAFLKESSEIKIHDILVVFNDAIEDKQCVLGIGFCKGNDIKEKKCALHDQWEDSKEVLQKMFKESSIEDITKEGIKL
ncbi:MAG: Rrf2 family transcriptional regulator [Sulfurovum sp.]|nr:Rrf2 family transcriptional regulator [Sulfurovum sp.]